MKDARELLEKYKLGQCTSKEMALLGNWFHHLGEEEVSELSELELITAKENFRDTFLGLEKGVDEQVNKKPVFKLWPRIAIAASLLVALSFGIYFYQTGRNTVLDNGLIVQHDVAPGGNKATLTLGDGTTINLSDNQEGIIISNDDINYVDGTLVIQSDSEGSLPTRPGNQNDNTPIQTLALTTPKGGQYQITLSDGTKVWLNAASTLKYPSRFNSKERRIELIGEAYFEVAHLSSRGTNDLIPFIVTSAGQKVHVLGTHFNINAYSDEGNIKTTLLEGSVKVSTHVSTNRNSTILKPGQQSILTNNTLNINTVDPETVIAWKNGYFIFDDEPLESIMRKISKWYDVEVFYEANLKNSKFGGIVSRANPISEVLKLMERTDKVNFKIEGKKITVLP